MIKNIKANTRRTFVLGGGCYLYRLNLLRHKFLSIFISIILCLSLFISYTPIQTHATVTLGTWTDTSGVSDVNYEVFDDGGNKYAVVTGPNTYNGVVLTVPATITIDEGNIGGGTVSSGNYGIYPVTEIGFEAFDQAASITGLNLSGATNLRIIRTSAFRDCNSFVGTLTIPSSLETIEYQAFYRCKFEYLDFSLPSNIKTIGQYAFSLNNFTNYTLVVPPSLEEIEEGAFLESKLGGVDFSNASGLISIKENGFRGCHSLTGTLTLPENLTTIGEAAFMDTGYTGVDFSKAVKLTNVDDCIFGDGNKYSGQITQITFGSSIPADSFSADTFKGIPTGGVVFCPAGTSEAASSFVATYLTSQGITGWSVYTALDVDVNSIPESIVGEAIEEVNIISSVLGGTPPLVSCELVGGSLPLGLTFSPDGKVSGTPTEITPAGEITVKVTDSGSGNLNQSKSIVVPYGKVRALGSDATLVSYELGGVSGSTAEALGTPAATYNDVAISAGAVTLTSAQAKNANFIATPTDETATLEYAYTATDTEPSFGAWTPRTIANDSYVWVKVTAEDGNTLIYKIKVTVTGASQPVIPDHHIIFHSHDSAYGGKDGLTAFGEDVVVEFEGDFDTVQSFNFDDEDYNLSAYKDDKTPRTITEEDGNVIGSITQGSAVVTLYSSFADRLENGTYELQVWFDDSIVGDDATAGIAEIVVQRDGSVVPVDGGTKTGDEASLNLFLTIGGISLLMLIALIVYRRKVLA